MFGDFDSDGDGIWGSQDECEDAEACNFPNPTESCNYEGVDVNENGLCDDDEVTGCTYAFSAYNEDATFDDGSLRATSMAMTFVTMWTTAWAYLTPVACATAPVRFMSPIPEGDCDCDGNQLDALGVCGGGCAADADGICDDVDDCVGA